MSFKSKATGIFAAAVISVGMAGGALAQEEIEYPTDVDMSVNVINEDEVTGALVYGFLSGDIDFGEVEVTDDEDGEAGGSVDIFLDDTRDNSGGVSLNMGAGDFTSADTDDVISNSNLGVRPSTPSPIWNLAVNLSPRNVGDSTTMFRTLGPHSGETTQDSSLNLTVPAGTASGDYSSVLSLTVSGNVDDD